MAPETSTAPAPERGKIAEAFARAMDEQARADIVEREGTIASIGDVSRQRVRELSLPRPKGDDGAALSGTLPSQEEVATAAEKLQRERMALIENDPEAKVQKLEPHVGGMFDGELWISAQSLINGSRTEINRIFKHEAKHRKDGVRTRGIDQPLIAETGIAEIDETLPDTTERNVLEEGAMRAENAPPSGPYVEEHWKPAKELEEAFRESGQDGTRALQALQEDDLAAFEQARTKLLIHHITTQMKVEEQELAGVR